jgi:hypothetical protein
VNREEEKAHAERMKRRLGVSVSPELARLEAAMAVSLKAPGAKSLDVPTGDDNTLPFILMSIQGEEASGKTDLALRGPKAPWNGKAGLVYFHTDYGYDRVRKAVRKDPRIKVIGVPYVTPQIDKKKQWQKYAEEGLALHKGVWEPFVSLYHDATRHARTIVLDTGGEFYQFLRICHFGKLHQNPQLSYGPVKAEYVALIREAKRNHTNLILIHQQKDEYKRKMVGDEEKSFSTGNRVIDGMDKINYLIDAFLLARGVPPQYKVERDKATRKKTKIETEPRRWEVEILNAKHDLSLNGTILEDPDFATVAMMLKPEVDVEAWE